MQATKTKAEMDIDNAIFEDFKKKLGEKASGDKKEGQPVLDAVPSKYIFSYKQNTVFYFLLFTECINTLWVIHTL